MESSSSSEQRKDSIDFPLFDDVPSESGDRCKAVVPIRKLNIEPIYPSILDFQPKTKYKPAIPYGELSTCKCSSSKEKNYDVYVPLAKKALEYYNNKEHSSLLFLKVSAATSSCGRRKRKTHMNVVATTENGVEKLMFAELIDDIVQCCLLEKTESGNPIGWGCGMCRKEVIHPGPRHGCLIVGGDLFEGYSFWGYRSLPRDCNSTPDDYNLYFACAMKAAEYFNSKQSTDFMPVEVMGSFTCPCHHKKVVHINFKGVTSIESHPELFFAELVVPNFTVDSGGWDIRKEPFITVNGCCLLEKVGPGNPFGRDCEVCYCRQLVHPGRKNGYRVRVGDDFGGYGFRNIGLGIF